MIDYKLSKANAEELFHSEAVFICGRDAVPEYRLVELFGVEIGHFIEQNLKDKGYLIWDTDVNAHGSCASGRPCLHYYYESGFLKVVAEHNYLLTVQSWENSEAGRAMDAIWKARSARLKAEDAEYERKLENRKSKRAAAKAAKQKTEEAESE